MTDSFVQPLRSNTLRLSTRAHDYLHGLIEDGTFQPGEQLPSQNDLAAQLGISRATLREALLNLEQDGLVVRRQGVGTFVTSKYENRLESGLERLESILDTAARQGMELAFDELQVEQGPADHQLSSTLQVEKGTPLTTVRRVLTANGKPVAYMVDVVPSAILAPSDIDETFTGSVLDLLRERPEIQIAQASANIVSLNADSFLSHRLRIGSRQALLLMEETLFGTDGTVIEISRNFFVPDFFEFHVVRG